MEQSARRWLLGIIFIAVGGILLLDNFGVIEFYLPDFLWRWEMILVIIGAVNLINRNYSAAFVLFTIASFFIIKDLYDLRYRELWPLVFIVIGISIILKRTSIGSKKKSEYNNDSFDDVAIFGGNEKSVRTDNFTGGKVTSIFGGSSLDLSNCKLQEGTTVIDVFTMFGGCELKVPSHWNIKLEVTTILGGFDDKRKVIDTTDESRILVIRGFTMFGGGEVRN